MGRFQHLLASGCMVLSVACCIIHWPYPYSELAVPTANRRTSHIFQNAVPTIFLWSEMPIGNLRVSGPERGVVDEADGNCSYRRHFASRMHSTFRYCQLFSAGWLRLSLVSSWFPPVPSSSVAYSTATTSYCRGMTEIGISDKDCLTLHRINLQWTMWVSCKLDRVHNAFIIERPSSGLNSSLMIQTSIFLWHSKGSQEVRR